MNLHLEAFYCSFIFNNIRADIKNTPFIKVPTLDFSFEKYPSPEVSIQWNLGIYLLVHEGKNALP